MEDRTADFRRAESPGDLRKPIGYSEEEIRVRDSTFLATDGMTMKEGRLWNEAWDAARKYHTEGR